MLRLHEDPDRFVTHFSGSDRLIADYLSEEVLEAQPEPRRVFLLECSVLDEMCADLVGPPDRGTRRPAGPRGAGAGVDVPPSSGRPPGVVPVPPSLPGPASVPAASRGPGRRGPPAGAGRRVAPGSGGGRPGHRVPLARPGLGRGAGADHAPRNRGLRARADGHRGPVDHRGTRDQTNGPQGGQPPPRPPQGRRGSGGRRRRHPAWPARRSGSHAGRAGLRPSLPRHHGPVPHQPRRHGADGSCRPGDAPFPGREPRAGRDQPERPPVLGDHGPGLRRPGPLPGRPDGGGQSVDGGRAGVARARRTRPGGSASSGRLVWSKPGSDGSSGPRPWPTKR